MQSSASIVVPTSLSGEEKLDFRDRDALLAVRAADRVWQGLALARDVITFAKRTILHAGPSLGSARIAAPLLKNAAWAVVYEGWAPDITQALALLENMDVILIPAQDRRAVISSSSVLSPNMVVQVIRDRANPLNLVFSPLSNSKHARRTGSRYLETLSHLRWSNGNLAATLEI